MIQNEEFISVEEDFGQDRFFALLNEGTHYRYVQYNGYYNEVFTISRLEDLGAVIPGVSAVDTFFRRYFFVSKKGKTMFFNTIGLDTGEVIAHAPLLFFIVSMDYDIDTDVVYALANTGAKSYLSAKIDPMSGESSTLFNVRNLFSLIPETSFINKETREFWTLAKTWNRKHILSFSLDKGRSSEKRAMVIEAGEHKGYNFNTELYGQILFSVGTKDSIILAGHNDTLKMGFIAHFTIESKNVKEVIDQLQNELLQVTLGGIADFDVYLTAAKPYENFLAYTRTYVLERKLREDYGVEDIDKKEFFVGKPYSVFLSADGVMIQ